MRTVLHLDSGGLGPGLGDHLLGTDSQARDQTSAELRVTWLAPEVSRRTRWTGTLEARSTVRIMVEE